MRLRKFSHVIEAGVYTTHLSVFDFEETSVQSCIYSGSHNKSIIGSVNLEYLYFNKAVCLDYFGESVLRRVVTFPHLPALVFSFLSYGNGQGEFIKVWVLYLWFGKQR